MVGFDYFTQTSQALSCSLSRKSQDLRRADGNRMVSVLTSNQRRLVLWALGNIIFFICKIHKKRWFVSNALLFK